MTEGVRVALGQMAARKTVAENLEAIARLAEEAGRGGAELLVLPEGAMAPFAPRGGSLQGVAEALDGPFVAEIARLSKTHGLAIVAGMFEAAPGSARVFNTVVACSGGRSLGAYRKIHLFDGLGQRESDSLRPGPGDLLRFRLGQLEVGVITCYDLRFPELTRLHATAGLDLLLVPSAWYAGPLKEEQWSILARARAIENLCFVVAVSQPGPIFIGRSLAVDPRGVVLASADEHEALLLVDLAYERITAARRNLPALEHVRFGAGKLEQ